MRLLIVEDEARIASFVAKGLQAHGHAVDHAATGTEALSRVREQEFDLLVLDLRLPDIDGLEVLRLLREDGAQVPVIILTARGGIDDRVKGLDLGADDYLTKPFAFDELLARVRARLRRRHEHEGSVLEAGRIQLDLHSRRARVGEREADLTVREFALLETFLRHPGQVLSREELLAHAWGYQFDPRTNLVDVYVGYLRRKLGDDALETVRGAGYRLRDEPARTAT